MAKTGTKPEPIEQKQGGKEEIKKGGNDKKQQNNKEVEYKPGMSYLYDPCPHRVWTPKPGERDKSEPRGVGSPWYEPVKKKEEADKEESEKKQKKEGKAQKKRQKAYDEKKKKLEEEESKRKDEENKRKEMEEKKQKEKEKKEKEKKRRERQERKEQQQKRMEEKERKKAEEEEENKKGVRKEKPQASYMYEPCPHKVYTPAPGEKDMADPKGAGSPWYVPVKKKEDIEREDEDKRKEENKKIIEDAKKRRKERRDEEKRQAEKQCKEEERLKKREEMKRKRRQEERENKKLEEERKEMEHEEMGCGIRDGRTDLTPELICIMDFIKDVDECERERRGEALRWKKEELEVEIESLLAKDAHIRDFRELVKTFIEAEWIDADNKLTKLERDERRRRRMLLQNMDPLAKDMLNEGKRTRMLYEAAVAQTRDKSNNMKGRREREWGDGPSTEEDALISQVMKQMDLLVGKVAA